VTARGNHGQAIAYEDADYVLYRKLLSKQAKAHRVEVWAWTLISTHLHLILVPPSATALARAVGETHRRYAAAINAKLGRVGHVFAGAYSSAALDEEHLRLAIRYLAMAPVRARLVNRPEDWP